MPARMAYAIDALCFIVFRVLIRSIPQEQTVRIHNHIRGIGRRFAALYARFEAGTLAPPRPHGGGARIRPEARDAALVPLPRGPGWLAKMLPEAGRLDAAGFAWQIRLQVEQDAAMQAFLAAAPQAGRLLRPLLRMLSPDPLPQGLQLQPRSGPPTPVAPACRTAESASPERRITFGPAEPEPLEPGPPLPHAAEPPMPELPSAAAADRPAPPLLSRLRRRLAQLFVPVRSHPPR